MVEPLALLPAEVAVDASGRIHSWSPGAERLLGHQSKDVLRRRMHDVLESRDVFGNRLCGDGCNLREMMRRGETPRRFELWARHGDGHQVLVIVEIAPGNGSGMTYRFLPDRRRTERRRPRDLEVQSLDESPTPEPKVALSPRETAVLGLLAQGRSTAEISRSLGISTATAKNHVQHVLEKLGAHSRIEAVSVARQRRLV